MASREGYLAKLLADSLGVPIADVDRVLQEDATGNVAKFFEADGPSKIVFSNEGEVRPAVAAPHGQRAGGGGAEGRKRVSPQPLLRERFLSRATQTPWRTVSEPCDRRPTRASRAARGAHGDPGDAEQGHVLCARLQGCRHAQDCRDGSLPRRHQSRRRADRPRPIYMHYNGHSKAKAWSRARRVVRASGLKGSRSRPVTDRRPGGAQRHRLGPVRAPV